MAQLTAIFGAPEPDDLSSNRHPALTVVLERRSIGAKLAEFVTSDMNDG
jgi:hypothetical protein